MLASGTKIQNQRCKLDSDLSLLPELTCYTTRLDPQAIAQETNDNTEPHIPSPECNLVHLRLHDGRLTGLQLLRFAQSPRPILSNVFLARVSGLQNNDLLPFLRIVSSTLAVLRIWDCDIPRITADEEYALDVVIPDLSAIQSVTVNGDHLSSLAISGKASWSPHKGKILITGSHKLTCDSLVKSMETSHWGAVNLTWFGALTEAEEALRLQAADIAHSRGIIFNAGVQIGSIWTPILPIVTVAT